MLVTASLGYNVMLVLIEYVISGIKWHYKWLIMHVLLFFIKNLIVKANIILNVTLLSLLHVLLFWEIR